MSGPRPPALPHRFPFRFLDRQRPDGLLAELTAGSPWQRDGSPLAPSVLLEILAQAAQAHLAGHGSAAPAATGYLAAIDNARFSPSLARCPLVAGQTVRVEIERSAGFGRLTKIHGRLFRRSGEGGEEEVASADLVLGLGPRRGDRSSAPL